MNKLLVSDIINLDNGEYILNCQNDDINIKINGEVKLYLYNEKTAKLNIDLKDNSTLKIYIFNDNKANLEVNINQNNNSKIYYNEAFINELNNKLIINNSIVGNNNESYINIRNICNKNKSEIIINVEIKENTINNIALEDLKGINNGGMVHIEPNIICLSNEVVANHLTTIGGVDKNSLNYLMSKGINEEKSKKILLKGFIYSNMDENFKKNFGGD